MLSACLHNQYGFYSITVPEGVHRSATYIGFGDCNKQNWIKRENLIWA
jgi:hypothetical protein